MSALAKLEAPQVRERPILFKGEMVRAILAGQKTQTRRVLAPQPVPFKVGDEDCFGLHPKFGGGSKPVRPPFGVPGDRLWVRETFVLEWPEMDRPEDEAEFRRWVVPHYAATGPKPDLMDQNTERPIGWRPSIFMPRWACRLVVEVTEVRVQRVTEISEADAFAEGVEANPYFMADGTADEAMSLTARDNFAHLWDSINEPRGFGWDANPWVWCVSFKRVTP